MNFVLRCCNKNTKYLPLDAKQKQLLMGVEINYDISYLEKISNKDMVFIKEMIETFVENTPVYLEDIMNHYSDKNFDLLYKAVHKFIPTLAFVSAKEYIDKFDKLEKLALDKKDDNELHELINELKDYSSNIIELLKKDFNL